VRPRLSPWTMRLPLPVLAAGQLRDVAQEVKGDLQVVVDHRVFADPVQRGHGVAFTGGAT